MRSRRQCYHRIMNVSNDILITCTCGVEAGLGIMEATGDRDGSIRNYRRSLELNPSNQNAVSHLSALRKS